MRPIFHLPAIWHTRLTADDRFSHCAFTTKVRLLPRTLRAAFPDATIHLYVAHGETNEAAEACGMWGDERFDIHSLFSTALHTRLLGHASEDETRFVGTDARWDSPLYFNANAALRNRLTNTLTEEGRHVILHPFGPAHRAATEKLPGLHVESGIGYGNPYLPHRIYESFAWLHHCCGLEHRQATDYEHVIPPTIDETVWAPSADWLVPDRPTVVLMGRIVPDKGLHVVREVAARLPEVNFVWYGQGNGAVLQGGPENLRYGGVLTGVTARAQAMGTANAVLCPSRFIEPGSQAHAEALTMGTPVLASAHGVFTESIIPGVNGQLCRTLGDWVASVAMAVAGELAAPHHIRQIAVRRFGRDTAVVEYRAALQQYLDLYGDGWMTDTPRNLVAPQPLLQNGREHVTSAPQQGVTAMLGPVAAMASMFAVNRTPPEIPRIDPDTAH